MMDEDKYDVDEVMDGAWMFFKLSARVDGVFFPCLVNTMNE